LQRFADETGLTITVTHYPTSASKWNWIEHRLFCHISANWAGEPLGRYETVLKFIRTITTETGLCCLAYLDRKHYRTKVTVTPEQKKPIVWSSTACSRSGTTPSGRTPHRAGKRPSNSVTRP